MKREFGSKLIEDFLAHKDLRLVADTSGAYIPGHGTPTVIIVGRNQRTSRRDRPRGTGRSRRARTVPTIRRRALSGHRSSSTSIPQAGTMAGSQSRISIARCFTTHPMEPYWRRGSRCRRVDREQLRSRALVRECAVVWPVDVHGEDACADDHIAGSSRPRPQRAHSPPGLSGRSVSRLHTSTMPVTHLWPYRDVLVPTWLDCSAPDRRLQWLWPSQTHYWRSVSIFGADYGRARSTLV